MRNLVKIVAYSIVGIMYLALAPAMPFSPAWQTTGLTLIGIAITLFIDCVVVDTFEDAFINKAAESEHQQLLAELTAIRAELTELRAWALLPRDHVISQTIP